MHTLKIVLILLFLTLPLSASNKVKILILHSYSQEYAWTKSQHDGFVSKLNKSDGTFEFFTEYLDTKRLQLTQKYTDDFTDYLKMKYLNEKPDLIYVTDDNALNFIYQNYSKLYENNVSIPVFFSGVNNVKMDKLLPKNTFRGVYETKEIASNIKLIKQFSPQTRDIYIIGDNSNTHHAIKKELLAEEKEFPNMAFHYASDKHISKVIELLPNDKKIFVLLTTIGTLKDANNKTMLPQESLKELQQKRNLIILTMEDSYMYGGVIGGRVTSGKSQGLKAAELTLQYLKSKSLKGITSIKKGSNIYIFDYTELTKARIFLSEYISRDATIIHSHKNFIQKNQITILESLIFLLLFLLFILLVVYAIHKKKYIKQEYKLGRIDFYQRKLKFKKLLLNYILDEEDMAYWRMDIQTGVLTVSDQLTDKLKINLEIYTDDKNVLSYFIHYSDKNLFNAKLQEVQVSKKSLSFHHKMISTSKDVFNVKHVLYYAPQQNNESANILGIIKFEE